MIDNLRTLWAIFRAWLAGQFMAEPPTVPPVEPEEEPIYHTMDGGGEAVERKNGRAKERGKGPQ